MKSSLSAEHFVRALVVLSFLAFTVSCKQDQEPTPTQSQTTAQFEETTLAFLENEGEKIISLTFDKPAQADGQIVLKINTIAPQSFSTVPAAALGQLVLPVFKGQVKTDFKMIPSDNPTLDGCKVVKFSIAFVTEGLQAGLLRDLVVSVNDDESPVEAGFESKELRVRENDLSAPGIDIQLVHAAPAEGILVIRLQSTSKYGADYTTEPAAVGNKIFLHVQAGETFATVKVYPSNDMTYRPDREISMTIIDATGGLRVGTENLLQFTITEDDGYQLSNIASIRSMYNGDIMILHNDTYIAGIVATIDNITPGSIVVDDGSGGLQVRFNTQHNLTRGDLVLINLNYGLLHDLHGVLEVSQVSEFEKIGDDEVRVKRMTLEDLYETGASVQSQTIQLMGLTFPDANGSLPMLGDRVATDGIRTITVRTNTFASFRDDLVPGGVVNVTGIFTIVDGRYFLFPQEGKDIKRQQFMLKRD